MKYKIDSDEAVIRILLILANSDGNFHDNEKKFVEKIAEKRGLSNEIYDSIATEVTKSNIDYKELCLDAIDKIESHALRKETLTELTNLAAADFILHEDEMLLLQIIAEKWNMFQESSHV